MNRAQRRAATKKNRSQTKSKMGLSVLAATSLVSGSTALLTALPAHAVTCYVDGGSNADLWNEMQFHLNDDSCDVIVVDDNIVLNTDDDDSDDDGYGPWYVDRSVTIQGDGRITLDADYESNIFRVDGEENNITLTLRDLDLIEGDAGDQWAYSDNGGAIVQEDSTDGELTLVLDDVRFYNNYADSEGEGLGGAIFIDRGSVYLNDSVVFGNDGRENGAGTHGGAIYIENGDVIVQSGATAIFEENRADLDGGAINLEFGDLKVYGAVLFDQNGAGQNGGAVHIDSGSVIFDDAEYFAALGNYSGYNGGAVYINSGTANFTGADGEFNVVYFAGNVAFGEGMGSGRGGAIYVNDATSPVSFAYVDAEFLGNAGLTDGGAIYIGAGDLDFTYYTDVEFLSNATYGDGGAIYLGEGSVNFESYTQATFVQNEAEYDGGAINIVFGSVEIDSDSSVAFVGNDAEDDGGAVYIEIGEFNSSGLLYALDNDAYDDYFIPYSTDKVGATDMDSNSGGAIYISEGNIDISGTSTFSNNYAEGDGGAIAVDFVTDHIKLNGTQFYSNDAESDGGAIHVYNANGAEITLTNVVFNENTVYEDDGGAISIDRFEDGTFTITGSRFDENSTEVLNYAYYDYGDIYGDKGGAIYVDFADDLDFSITSTTFTENYSGAQGGAIRVNDIEYGSLTVTSSTFNSNDSRDGGAISVGDAEYADFEFTDSTFIQNSAYIADPLILTAEVDADEAVQGEESDEVDAADHYWNGRDGGAIHIDDIEDGSLTITRVTFTGNDAGDDGGAIYINDADDASITITSSTFTSNEAVSDEGGAIKIDNSDDVTLTITNATFTSNDADNDGGAIAIDDSDSSTILISNSTFRDNDAGDDGGAIYIEGADSSDITFANLVFTSNEANSDGGAIHFDSDADYNTIIVSDSNFTSNRALNDAGGAISHDGSGADIYITDSTFTTNSSLTEQGGAIYVSSSYTNVYVENSVFLDNDAEGDGGAIYLDDAVLILNGGNLFQGNSTEEDGGAIYADTVLGSGKDIFINNSAAIDGGAISSRTIDIQNKFFGENTAGEWGGALIGSFVNVVNSTFFNNQAGDEGGAIWSAGLLGEGDTVQNTIAMNTFLVNRVGNEGDSVGLSIYTTGKMNLFGNIFASNDSPQSHLEVGGGEGAPEFIDLGANYFTSQGDTDVLTAESSRLVTFSELTIVQGPVVDNTDSMRTFVAPITTDSLASDAIDTTEFAATLTALGLNGEITDQRGVVRTGKYDAGAFEVGDTTYRKPQIDQQAEPVVIAPKVVLPSAPAKVNIKAEGRKAIRVNWTAPKTTGTGKILRYEIYRNGKKVATLPASARTYLDRNLDSRQSYTYRIVTVGSQGNSIKSPNTKSIFPRR